MKNLLLILSIVIVPCSVHAAEDFPPAFDHAHPVSGVLEMEAAKVAWADLGVQQHLKNVRNEFTAAYGTFNKPKLGTTGVLNI